MNTLNKSQLAAVTSGHNRILTLAGAGTGKTKTMVTRAAKLIEEGVDPENILLLTFTNAAAREQKERLISMVGEPGEKVWASTFHSWAVREIRRHGRVLGYSPEFSIYDREDTLSIVTDIIEDMQYKLKPEKVLEAMGKRNVYNVPVPEGDMLKVVREYEFRCRQQNAIDLDGLIITLQSLLNRPLAQEVLKSRYKYVFVDEMQDTDHRQMALLRTLDPDNLFVVGDDFQAIYGFRGSDVGIIMELAEDPDWEVIKLEENYRSTRQIVDAANRLIKHNKQTEKVLKAHRDGAEISVLEFETPDEELEWIAGKCIFAENPSDIAILARTNRQVSTIAQRLSERDIPYEIKSKALDILQTQEARKLTKWMEAVRNPRDKEAIMAVVNWPEQTITKRDLLKAEMFQLENDCSMITAFQATETAIEFLRKYESILKNETAKYLLADIVSTIGIEKVNEQKGLSNRNLRIQDFLEAVSAWDEDRNAIGETATPEDWAEFYKVRLVEGMAPREEEKKDAVQLMTIHGSKGLEFKQVIISGLNQKSLPLGKGDIEEERRLCYVGITRAKDELYLTRSKLRTVWGDTMEEAEHSIFLDEIAKKPLKF